MELIQFIKNFWTETISPTIKSSWDRSRKNTEDIIGAIYSKDEISINNPGDITNPIVEAQKETTQAIKDIPSVEIPKTDLSTLERKLDAVKEAISTKDMTVNIGETVIDTKSIIKAIENIKLEIPEMKEVEMTDYTLMLDEMMKIMERPKDHTEIKKLQELVKRLGTSEDLFAIAEWLKIIALKETDQIPFKFNDDGRLEVSVDRAGGGGGIGLTKIETDALVNISDTVATEAKQDTQITEAQLTNTKLDTLETNKATEAKQDDIITALTNSTDLEGGGKISVGTTAVEVTFTGTPEAIIITADTANTGVLYIGKSNVTNAGANAIAFLDPGESLTLEYNDTTNALYVVASATSQNFWKGCLL